MNAARSSAVLYDEYEDPVVDGVAAGREGVSDGGAGLARGVSSRAVCLESGSLVRLPTVLAHA